MVKSIKTEEFQTEVLDSSVPVMVDFYADWCGPCRVLSPVLEQISQEADDRYKVVKVDADVSPELCVQYGVNALPTLVVFQGGKVKECLVGIQPKNRLVEALEG